MLLAGFECIYCVRYVELGTSLSATQANIAMDEDKKEEQKKADVDRSKLEADIKAQKDIAGKVWTPLLGFAIICSQSAVPGSLASLFVKQG